MATISQNDFWFLLSIGIPYEGDVQGLGKVTNKIVNTVSNCPSSGAIAQGNFINSNYVSVITPTTPHTPQNEDKEKEKGIYNFLTRDKVYTDPVSGERYPLSEKTSLTVNVSNDNVEITFKNETSHIKHNMKFDQLRSIVQNSPQSRKTLHIGSQEVPIPNIDYLETSKKVRKVSGYALSTSSYMYKYVEMASKYNFNPNGYTTVFAETKIFGRNILLLPKGFDFKNSTLLKISKYAKISGNTLGGLALLAGGTDIYFNGLNWSNGTHLTMAALAMIPNPYTKGIATAYFIIDGILTLTTDQGLVEHIQDGIEYIQDYFSPKKEQMNLQSSRFMDSPIIYQDYNGANIDFGRNFKF